MKPQSYRDSTPSARVLILANTAFLFACTPPAGDLNIDEGDANCTLEQVIAGQLLAYRSFERTKGAPVSENFSFDAEPNSNLCLVVVSGVTDSSGVSVRPAPASMIAAVDDVVIAEPSDFNAHGQIVLRGLPGITPGTHDVTVELRGKPSSVATVGVVAVNGDGSEATGYSPVPFDRYMTPGKALTKIRDEFVIVAKSDISRSTLQTELNSLPFSSAVVGKSIASPVFQVIIPGAHLVDDTDQYTDEIKSLPSVKHASAHYASYIVPFDGPHYPPANSDPVYLNDDGTINTNTAWHLEMINAHYAWAHQTSGATIGIADTGFDMTRADFSSATCTSPLGDCSPPVAPFVCSTAAADYCADNLDSCREQYCEEAKEDPGKCPELLVGPGSDACNWYIGCFGAEDKWSFAWHGDAVATIAAGQSNNSGAVGVSWDSDMRLESVSRKPILNNSVELTEKYSIQVPNLEILAILDRLAHGDNPATIINMSFGASRFCPEDENSLSFSDEESYTELLDDTAIISAEFLNYHPDVMLVQASGNQGDLGSTSRDTGHACRMLQNIFSNETYPDINPGVLDQAMCIGAGTIGDAVATYSNQGGSQIVAPVGDSGTYIYGPDGDRELSGTSFAAPQVTGALSLMRAVNSELSPIHAKKVIQNTASQYDPSYHGLSYDMLDVHGAIEAAEDWTCGGFRADPVSVCPDFSDVDGHEYEQSISTLSCHCVLKGYADGSFLPDQHINRAEMLKIAVESVFPRSEIDSFAGVASSFPDVGLEDWYNRYVSLGEHYGFVTGIGGSFEPAQNVNRAEAAVMLARASYQLVEAGSFSVPDESRIAEMADAYVYYGGIDDQPAPPIVTSFPDVALGDWYGASVEAVAQLCIFNGTDDDGDEGTPRKYLPANELSRAEASHLACRLRFIDDQQCTPMECLY